MSEVKNTQEKVMEGFSNVDTKMNEVKASTVVPLYTAPSPAATPLMRPQNRGRDSFLSLLTLTNGHPSDPASGHCFEAPNGQ